MTEVKIYFNDLIEEVQEELFKKIEKELLNYGEVSPQGRNESKEEFQRRLEDQTDHYLNTHNFANRFVI